HHSPLTTHEAAYSVRSTKRASAKARRRSAHLLHRPQCRPALGRRHEKVSSSGKSRPRSITSDLCKPAYGRSTRTEPLTERLTASWYASKKAGVASGNGLLPSGASATAGTACK